MKGIISDMHVKYGDGTVTDGVVTIPTTWTEIPGITKLPDMSSAPKNVDATPVSAVKYNTSFQGLIDLSNLEFEALYTTEFITAITAAASDPGTGKARCFCIEDTDNALRYWCVGSTSVPMLGGGSAGDLKSTKFTVFAHTEWTSVAIA